MCLPACSQSEGVLRGVMSGLVVWSMQADRLKEVV